MGLDELEAAAQAGLVTEHTKDGGLVVEGQCLQCGQWVPTTEQQAPQ